MRKNIKKILFVTLFAILSITSCKSFVEKEAFSISQEDEIIIDTIIKNFESFKFSKDSKYLIENENLVNSLISKSRNNKYFEAKITGIKTELSYYKNENIQYQKLIEEIGMKNPKEEWYYYLKALILAKKPLEKINILNDGISKSSSFLRLKLLLSETYIEIADFKQSMNLLDEVILQNRITTSEHIKLRDSISFVIKAGLNNYKTLALINKDKLDTIDLLTILYNETSILEKFRTDKIDESYVKVLSSNYILPSSFIEPITKKYFALFIYNIFNPEQQKNDSQDKNITKKSIIGDLKTNSIYYEPAIFVIKWGIMDLDDGINFFPDKELNGQEIFEISKKTDILLKSRKK